MNIIAFAGVAGSGKTTAKQETINYLLKSYRSRSTGRIVSESFAAPIRDCLGTLGVFKDKDYTLYRSLATKIGAECRAHNPDFFVKKMAERLEVHERQGKDVVVIDDLRYPNELAFINGLPGAHSIFICIPPERFNALKETAAKQGVDHYNHESEAMAVNCQSGSLKDFQYTIYNLHSLDAFNAGVRVLLNEIIESYG